MEIPEDPCQFENKALSAFVREAFAKMAIPTSGQSADIVGPGPVKLVRLVPSPAGECRPGCDRLRRTMPIHNPSEADLDFDPYGCNSLPGAGQTGYPNDSNMSVATLGPSGEFISSRPLNRDELGVAWAEHNARHGKAAS